MSYKQTDYGQIQGISGRYTIHDIGCFITSFCNLLERFGRPIDPPALNRALIDRGLYIDVDDGIRDDVGWNTLNQFDSEMIVTGTGSSAVPPTVNAIVKFSYNSFQTGQPTTHFCVVDHITDGVVYILDSWDGKIKAASAYPGGVRAWATYELRKTTNTGGSEVNDKFTNEAEVKPFYMLLRGNEATLEERKGWIGKLKIDFINSPNTATEARNNAAERARAGTLAGQLDTANRDIDTKNKRITVLEEQLTVAQQNQTPSESQASAEDKADAASWRAARTALKALVA
jgi:hypothetical protein